MIGLRVTCDANGCGRHFDVAAVVGPKAHVDEVLAVPNRSSSRQPSVHVVGDVVLPDGWDSRNDEDRQTRTYCAEHAGADA